MLTTDTFEFTCPKCHSTARFSLHDAKGEEFYCTCSGCSTAFGFPKELSAKIELFAGLCKQIKKSETILSEAAVAVDVGPHQVKVPFKLLLTRLRSTLDLMINNQKLTISYRTEAAKVGESLLEEKQ
jgi:hypothetical protein